MKRRTRIAVAVGLTLAASALAPAAELGSDEVVSRLQSWLDATRALEGSFAQTLASGALGTGLEESGRFYLLRPGRMRWDYLDPEPKVAIVEGESTRLYIEEDAQLWEGRLEDGGLLAALLAGSAPLLTSFEPGLLATPQHGGEGAYRLRLVPRDDNGSFRQVVLDLRPPEFGIQAAEVLDGAGNRMLYRFFDTRRNGRIDESAFRFEPPPGTEVLRP